MLTDQLDFNNPDHVTILCKNDQQLTIHIRDGNSSVQLTYQLQQEDDTSKSPHNYSDPYIAYMKAHATRMYCDSDQNEATKDPGLCKDSGLCVDPILNEVTYKGPYFCKPPHPPLQQSEPDSDGSNVPERPLRGM